MLTKLEDTGLSINPLKCEWAVQETDWLGYWVTPDGLKPWEKRVNAILRLQPPRNASEVRTFLGMVNFYRDMWPRRSHMLAPFSMLANPQGKKNAPVIWTQELDMAFAQLKVVIAKDALMAFPNHNRP